MKSNKPGVVLVDAFGGGASTAYEIFQWGRVVAFRECEALVSDSRMLTVIVVDDDEVDREAVRRALRDVSVDVCEAASGPQALSMLKSDAPKPRLLLLDINMPAMDGFALLDAIRADPTLADTVVFVLTSSAREADMTEAYSRNVAGYLVKGDLGSRMTHLSSLLAAYSAAVRWPS